MEQLGYGAVWKGKSCLLHGQESQDLGSPPLSVSRTECRMGVIILPNPPNIPSTRTNSGKPNIPDFTSWPQVHSRVLSLSPTPRPAWDGKVSGKWKVILPKRSNPWTWFFLTLLPASYSPKMLNSSFPPLGKQDCLPGEVTEIKREIDVIGALHVGTQGGPGRPPWTAVVTMNS